MDKREQKLRKEIALRIKELFSLKEKAKKFIPGKSWIQYGGGVFDDNEINASVQVLLGGWFGLGEKAKEFETNLANFIGVEGSILTNSGSSSNFLAVVSLMSNLWPNPLKPGDEVITAACGFPTTVNPMITNGLIPVFVDINPNTYNLNAKDLDKAYSKKTRMVMIAHTLGNPNDMEKIVSFCNNHNLYLVEDNCDALGSEYDSRKTGSFGLMATQSFYPPHHITMGEGGAVLFNDLRFDRITRSLRDWGRACWCRGDEKNPHGACGLRFNYRIDGKPYDHKYITNQIGYNLKPIEPQAAMGVEQLKRIPEFIRIRKYNFTRLYNYSRNWEKFFILPQSLSKANPCWFSFPLTIRNGVKFSRNQITQYLEGKLIQTRPLFAGNITRQPAYKHVNYRKIGSLKNADLVFFNTFFVGIYPGLSDEHIDYIAENINDFLKKYR